MSYPVRICTVRKRVDQIATGAYAAARRQASCNFQRWVLEHDTNDHDQDVCFALVKDPQSAPTRHVHSRHGYVTTTYEPLLQDVTLQYQTAEEAR